MKAIKRRNQKSGDNLSKSVVTKGEYVGEGKEWSTATCASEGSSEKRAEQYCLGIWKLEGYWDHGPKQCRWGRKCRDFLELG